MNTKATSKFTFDTEFRPEGDLISNAARARQRKVLTQDEIDQMCAKARAEGLKAGQVRAAEAIAAAVTDCTTAVREAFAQAQTEIEMRREEASQLAFAAACKLAPVAIAALPVGDVEAALREAMHQAITEPRIVLRAAEPVIAALSDKLSEIAHQEGYDGRIVASTDPSLTGADCRIEWRGGGAERSIAALETAIAELISRHFTNSSTALQTKG
jgi:flagellar assembly protein FliH